MLYKDYWRIELFIIYFGIKNNEGKIKIKVKFKIVRILEVFVFLMEDRLI